MSERSNQSARQAAAQFLAKPLEQRLGNARRQVAARVSASERAFFHELAAGASRRLRTLELLLTAYANAPLKRIERKLRASLVVALYQIVYLDSVPDHAAVSEALKSIRSKRARGFANGILRQVTREASVQEVEPTKDLRRRSLPVDRAQWFLVERDFLPDPEKKPLAYEAARAGFSEEAASILLNGIGQEVGVAVMTHANIRPQSTLRFRGEPALDESILLELANEGAELEQLSGSGERLYGLEFGVDPAALSPFTAGSVTVQGPFAAQVAPFLAPAANEKILDLCAPPGGKTIHLAELCPDAMVFAFAHDPSGLQRLEETLARCPQSNIVTRQRPHNPFADGPFDAILLDVPCSNSGVLARRGEARIRLTEKNLAGLRKLQSKLLESALRRAFETPATNRVVYSTCSILPVENGDLVREVLKGFPGCVLSKEISSLPGGKWQDGGYAALIQTS